MEQETRGCVSRVTRVPGGKYPTPAIPGPIRNAIPRAQYGMQYQAHGSTGSTRVPHGSMVFQHSGGEILTIPDTPTTQGLSLFESLLCFNILVGCGGRDFDHPRDSHYAGVIPMVFQHSVGGECPPILRLQRGNAEREAPGSSIAILNTT